ncbi:hypothetical protein PHMEG_00023118 [Phytophthora megakarya]|uniref:Uncharacterized protein n=1 Tax=Phytophthora megakarya TaxID=4795 RepID=A0A225VH40_9STRA|nr:hypothetical protein PHMEG_00023118 [Phytophthora megakarya]
MKTFKTGDLVWMYRPPKGPKPTKFVHMWMDLIRIMRAAGYKTNLVRREGKAGELHEFIAHVSFLTTHRKSTDELKGEATDIAAQLEYEGEVERHRHDAQARAIGRTTAASASAVTAGASKRRHRPVATRKAAWDDESEQVVEISRRRRRSITGHYVLEFELRLAGSEHDNNESTKAGNDDKTRWISIRSTTTYSTPAES